MKERIRQSGSSLYEEQIKDARDILAYGFQDDVSYNPNILDFYTGNPIPIKIYDQKFSATYGVVAKFLTFHNSPISLGQLLFDSEKNEYWLCVESYDISGIHNEGKLGKCMRFLKWQDSSGNIKTAPMIVTSASKYNNGENFSDAIKIGSDQLMLFVQMNDDTIKLDRGMRFFIDENMKNPSVYEITRIDTALYTYMGKGFLSIIVTECTYTPTENELNLGVCNYCKKKDNDNTLNRTVSISGNRNLNIGYSRTYYANFSNNDIGNFEWNIVSDFDVDMETDGRKAELFVDDECLDGHSFLLQVKSGSGDIVAETKINITEGF